MENLDLIFALLNQYVFQLGKNNLQDLRYYFQTNPATSGNQLVEEVLNAVDTYNLEQLGQPLFDSILMKCCKTPAEKQQIMSSIMKWKSYGKEEIKPTIKVIQNLIAASKLEYASRLYSNDATEYIKYIKNLNLPTGDVDVFSSTTFSGLDINTIIAEDAKGQVPTNVDWLNKAFGGMGGINRGEIGVISAPPGVGKSLFAMDLACYMAASGEKVLYVCLGDMNYRDFIQRMSSIAFGVSFADAGKNIGMMYEQLKNLVGNNLEISVNPSGTVTSGEVVDFARNKNFSVVVVDHDGNFAGATDGESLYSTYSDIYNDFTKLSMEGRLVLICSQAKIFSWDKIIGLESLSDSSKKQHVADWIMTISNVNPDCPNHLYVMSLPKARRGEVGSRAYVIRIQGRFIEIPKGLYDQLRQDREKKDYTERDIQNMINQYKAQINKIQQSLGTATTPVSPGHNPFTK